MVLVLNLDFRRPAETGTLKEVVQKLHVPVIGNQHVSTGSGTSHVAILLDSTIG